jgi:uncharacterized protein with NAD-binding domain and iron-sulfur cluster
MATKVIVIGGGVAGMSAAHELAERQFEVEVYERRSDYVGGKARSVDVEVPGKKPLPGEHGFRFFPAFYSHITDTMQRIPVPDRQDPQKIASAFDHLVVAEKEMMARRGHEPLILLNHLPHSFAELRNQIQAIAHADIDFTDSDKDKIALKLWQILTSCWERRNNEYERQSWWDFSEADQQSEAYKTYFADGLTRTLVAAQARKISAKTGGDILVQLLLSMLALNGKADRVLNGPTNDVWLNPWLAYLQQIGVQYHKGWEAQEILFNAKTNRVTGVQFLDPEGTLQTITGDYYIFAVPVESMARLLGFDNPRGSFPAKVPPKNEALLAVEPTLENLSELADDTNWMNGIQYYLNREIPLLDNLRGHVIYSTSPWALTSISQLPLWPDFDIGQRGDGNVKSLLSIDISNWDALGTNGKPASACTQEEIRDEVWKQLQMSLNVGDTVVLPDLKDVLVTWFLDRDIVDPDDKILTQVRLKTKNLEPLLINAINTWGIRPSAITTVPNLFLAGDYVRTFTDLATMEGANESARRAVNGIIQATGANVPFCRIWNLYEPIEFTLFKWCDRWRYYRGLPWQADLPCLLHWVHRLIFFVQRIANWLKR